MFFRIWISLSASGLEAKGRMNQVLSRLKAGFARRWYAPAIELRTMAGLIRLGSRDCGLTVMPSSDLMGRQS